MSRGKKPKKGGGKSAAKMAARLTRELNEQFEKEPEPKKWIKGGRPSEVHGKIGTAKERDDRRKENEKLKQAVKKQDFQDL